MNNITVLVVDDNQEESDALVKVLRDNSYHVAGVATSKEEGVQMMQAYCPDVIIIDVFLQGQPDGILFAGIVSTTTRIPFVFLTNSKDRQVFKAAHLTHPYSFLLKPFNELEIFYAIEISIEKCYDQSSVFTSVTQGAVMGSDFLFVKRNSALVKVGIADIIYIEVAERYCHIVTLKDKFVVQMTLKKILEILVPYGFIQTNRSYIINRSSVVEIVPVRNEILLSGDHRVAYSDKYDSFMDTYKVLR